MVNIISLDGAPQRYIPSHEERTIFALVECYSRIPTEENGRRPIHFTDLVDLFAPDIDPLFKVYLNTYATYGSLCIYRYFLSKGMTVAQVKECCAERMEAIAKYIHGRVGINVLSVVTQ